MTSKCCKGLSNWHSGGTFGLKLFKGFTDADDWHKVVSKRGSYLCLNHIVGFIVILASFAVTD
ncbi:unannotated protein [freshwater metagenome]|uniref:Unannotated protein n=1 Tax=freshwater metagenome TaxID=449393 RepID=A0A6J6HGB6_9ZZZZ